MIAPRKQAFHHLTSRGFGACSTGKIPALLVSPAREQDFDGLEAELAAIGKFSPTWTWQSDGPLSYSHMGI